MGLSIEVRLFAVLREQAGRECVTVDLDDGATVADALDRLARRADLGEPLARLPVRMAVNREYADPETALRAGDELALIPPVSGGAAPHAAVREQPLSRDELARAVADPGAGALVLFEGMTREVERLDYEAYREMAARRIAAILAECAARHELRGIAAEHRVGAVPLGEPAVIVAVSAAHRGPAFAAAREALDRIKAEAPIWKREVEGTRRRWVEGTPAPRLERAG